MSLLLVAIGLAAAALPAMAAPSGRRLWPGHWAKLAVAAFIGGAVATEAGLVAEGAPTVLSAAGVSALAHACERLLQPLVPAGAPLGWFAATAAVAFPLAGALALLQAHLHRLRVADAVTWLGHPTRVAAHAVTVVAGERPLALSLGGKDPRIVVSSGLLAVLAVEEVEVVLRHEAAHIAHRHGRLLSLTAALGSALAWFPPARASAAAIRVAVERWADESATAGSAAARARLRLALLQVGGMIPPPAAPALSDASTVVERVRGLEGEPPAGRLGHRVSVYLPGAGLGLAAMTTAGVWLGQIHTVVVMAGRCSA
jgi:Zn-dependent protease with chaperone function